jgi:hypothetical protein
MGWLNNTYFIFHGLRYFTAAAYERASKRFDNRYCLIHHAMMGIILAKNKHKATESCNYNFQLAHLTMRGSGSRPRARKPAMFASRCHGSWKPSTCTMTRSLQCAIP